MGEKEENSNTLRSPPSPPPYVVTRFVLASSSLATSIRAFNDGIKIQDNRCFEQSRVMILVEWAGLVTSFPSYALGILKLRFHSDNASNVSRSRLIRWRNLEKQ